MLRDRITRITSHRNGPYVRLPNEANFTRRIWGIDQRAVAEGVQRAAENSTPAPPPASRGCHCRSPLQSRTNKQAATAAALIRAGYETNEETTMPPTLERLEGGVAPLWTLDRITTGPN